MTKMLLTFDRLKYNSHTGSGRPKSDENTIIFKLFMFGIVQIGDLLICALNFFGQCIKVFSILI